MIFLIYTWWPDGKIRSCGKPSEETSPEFWNRLSISESCYRQGEVENEGTEGVLMYSKSSSPQPEKCVWFREKYHHSLSSRRSPDIQTDSLSDRFKMSKTIKMSRRLKIFMLLPKRNIWPFDYDIAPFHKHISRSQNCHAITILRFGWSFGCMSLLI